MAFATVLKVPKALIAAHAPLKAEVSAGRYS
jgi:hypothetical protein